MSTFKRLGIVVFIQMLIMSLFLPAIASGAPLTGGHPEPVHQNTPLLTPQAATYQIPVIDHNYLNYIDFVSVSEQEIVSIWATTSGCDFTLRFTPDEPVALVSKSGPMCNFESWVDEATIWMDSDRVISIWDHSEWLALFAYTSGIGRGGDDDTDSPVPPPQSWLEVEQMDDCGRAIARATLTTMLCGMGFGMAWGATAGTLGTFSFALVGAVAVCALAMMDMQDAIAACQEEENPILIEALDDLLYYNDVIVDGITVDLFDMEAFVNSILEIEELLQQPYSPQNVASMVEIEGRMIETATAR